MQNSHALESRHIHQLVQRDKQNNSQIDQYFIDAMTVISQHLQEFYKEYATDEGMTLAQTKQAVNQWDIQHYMQAVRTLLGDNQPDTQLRRQLQVLQSKALLDKHAMLSALVSSGIAVAAFRTKNYASNELPKQYFNELSYRSPQDIINGLNQPQSVDDNQAEFNNRLSVHASTADLRAQEVLNGAITAGLTQASLDQLTKVQSQQDKRLSKNISSAANNLVSGIMGAFNYQSINNTVQGAKDAYSAVNRASGDNVVKQIWQTQEDDKVCEICAPLDGTIYDVGEGPEPEIDTHNNCRCTKPYCDEDGNLLDVYPS